MKWEKLNPREQWGDGPVLITAPWCGSVLWTWENSVTSLNGGGGGGQPLKCPSSWKKKTLRTQIDSSGAALDRRTISKPRPRVPPASMWPEVLLGAGRDALDSINKPINGLGALPAGDLGEGWMPEGGSRTTSGGELYAIHCRDYSSPYSGSSAKSVRCYKEETKHI